MPIELDCNSCGKHLRVADKAGGKKIRCPKCEAILKVPMPAADDDDDFLNALGGAEQDDPFASADDDWGSYDEKPKPKKKKKKKRPQSHSSESVVTPQLATSIIGGLFAIEVVVIIVRVALG